MLTKKMEQEFINNRDDPSIVNSILDGLQAYIQGVANKFSTNEDMQKDLIQEALLISWKRLEFYDSSKGARLITFLKQNIKWAMIQYIKDQKLDLSAQQEVDDECFADDTESLEDIIIKENLLENFLERLGTLSEKERDVFSNRVLGAETLSKVSKRYGTSIQVIQAVLGRANVKLGVKGVFR